MFYDKDSGYQLCKVDGVEEDGKCANKYKVDDGIIDHLTYLNYDFSFLVLACQV